MDRLTSEQIHRILNRYTVQYERDPDTAQHVARYVELGHTARGVGDTPEEAVSELIDLCQDTLSDLPEDQWPPPKARPLTLLEAYSSPRLTAPPGTASKVPATDEAQRFRERRIRLEKQIREWREQE